MGERYVYNIFLYFFFFFWGGGFHSLYIELPKSYTRHLSTWFIRSWYSKLQAVIWFKWFFFSTKVSPVDHLSPFHSYKHVQKLKRIFPNGIMVRKKNWFTDILTTELIWNKITTTKITINFHFLKPETCITAETRAASCTVLQSVVENILPLTFLSFKVIIK